MSQVSETRYQPETGRTAETSHLSETKQSVLTTVRHGRRIILVTLVENTLYVFSDAHRSAGPVLGALRHLTFEPVLPTSVRIPESVGMTAVSVDEVLSGTESDHVLLINFSRDLPFVVTIQNLLGRVADGRLYRLDATPEEKFSKDWTEQGLLQRITALLLRVNHP